MPKSLVFVLSGVIRTFKAMNDALTAALAIMQSSGYTVCSFSLNLKGSVNEGLVSSFPLRRTLYILQVLILNLTLLLVLISNFIALWESNVAWTISTC